MHKEAVWKCRVAESTACPLPLKDCLSIKDESRGEGDFQVYELQVKLESGYFHLLDPLSTFLLILFIIDN